MSRVNSLKRYSCIWYPESLPNDWETTLHERRCEYAYILHDKDVWSEADQSVNPKHVAGTAKKPHFHIILIFPTAVSSAEMESLSKSLNQTCFEGLKDLDGSKDYFTHKNASNKYQYSDTDIVYSEHFSDVVNVDSFSKTKINVGDVIGDITDYVIENEISEFSHLVRFARSSEAPNEWFSVIVDKTSYFRTFIQSFRFSLDERGRIESIQAIERMTRQCLNTNVIELESTKRALAERSLELKKEREAHALSIALGKRDVEKLRKELEAQKAQLQAQLDNLQSLENIEFEEIIYEY